MSDTVTVYGASDDLIEVEGAISEEFPANADERNLLAFPEGTVLGVRYDEDGCWRINVLHEGSLDVSIRPAGGADSDNYSDRATLTAEVSGEVCWVVFGTEWAKNK